MAKKSRIVFMGTPEFAVSSLKAINEAGCEIVGVVTVPDKPAGRGKKLTASPVKRYALEHNLPLLQPPKLKAPEFLDALKALEPDLMVVVAFRMLPSVVWSIPKIGTFNLHASFLPDYRGAAPINWVVINGEEKTGLTTFFIDKQIDTGNILLQEEVDIPIDWTAGDLHDHMMVKGAALVLKTVRELEKEALSARPQDNSKYHHPAPKIFKDDCRIDWTKNRAEVYNFIRGLSPYPASYTYLHGKLVKIFFASMAEEDNAFPGTLEVDHDSMELKVACKDGWLSIKSLQIEGKKRVEVGDFLRGYRGELNRFDPPPEEEL